MENSGGFCKEAFGEKYKAFEGEASCQVWTVKSCKAQQQKRKAIVLTSMHFSTFQPQHPLVIATCFPASKGSKSNHFSTILKALSSSFWKKLRNSQWVKMRILGNFFLYTQYTICNWGLWGLRNWPRCFEAQIPMRQLRLFSTMWIAPFKFQLC